MEEGRERDAEHVAERAQGAGGGGLGVRRCGGEDCQGGGVAEQVVELGGVAGGLVAEDADDPGVALGEADGGRAAGAAGARGARVRIAAGGEAGQKANEALLGVGDTGVERQEEGAEEG